MISCLCAEWLFFTFILDDLHTLKAYDDPETWVPVHRRLMDIINTGKDPAPAQGADSFHEGADGAVHPYW
ncbi:hypothetical protein ACRAWF_19395 [Streptomyces sp. L7]